MVGGSYAPLGVSRAGTRLLLGFSTNFVEHRSIKATKTVIRSNLATSDQSSFSISRSPVITPIESIFP